MVQGEIMTREQKVQAAKEWLGNRWILHKDNLSKYRAPSNLIPNQSRGGAVYTSHKLVKWGLI